MNNFGPDKPPIHDIDTSLVSNGGEAAKLGIRPLRVLVAENDLDDAELVIHELEQAGFSVTSKIVGTSAQFTEAIRHSVFDIVLADYRMPGWTGMDALEILRKAGSDIPFIVVTGTLGEEAAVNCIKRGADDCVMKDRLARLPIAVERALQEESLREERRHAQAALQASEERYRLLFERSLAGVYRTTLDGRMLDLNEACARMFGYPSREEAMRHTLWDIAPSAEEMQALILLVQQQRTFTNLEVRLRRIDGRPVWALGAANLIVDEAGGPPYIEGTLLDITERKSLEEQLRQSQRIEAVGRLAGGIAHDFNNLLTAILGYSDLALERLNENSRLRRHVNEIKKAGERAAALTRQLLAFSRLQVLAPQVLDLNALVADLEKILRRVIGEDIDLSTSFADDLGRVKADPSQIDQVIMNLAVNSRDAMPEGGQLRIATSNLDVDEATAARHVGLQPGPYVLLTVSDTGCGMDAETKARIFEPFFTTKELGKGTGLGLSTVYGVVKQSGGYIWVDSEPGKGATFTVYLPRVEGVPEAARPAEPAAAPAREADTILLVEDEEAVRLLVQRILKSKGYRVAEASRPDEALAFALKHKGSIQLLLTDLVMPQMSGRELARRLAPIHPETRVLFTSGYAGDMMQTGFEPGAEFLQKPFTSETLARKVREVLDKQSA